MNKFLLMLILIFSLQSIVKADDIRVFQIEGISIGDSVLKYLSKKTILKELEENKYTYQFLEDPNLENVIFVGFTATKKLGKAVKRNKAKRIMRELARKVITKYGKINSYYVLIAKSSIFEIPFDLQENELKKIIS